MGRQKGGRLPAGLRCFIHDRRPFENGELSHKLYSCPSQEVIDEFLSNSRSAPEKKTAVSRAKLTSESPKASRPAFHASAIGISRPRKPHLPPAELAKSTLKSCPHPPFSLRIRPALALTQTEHFYADSTFHRQTVEARILAFGKVLIRRGSGGRICRQSGAGTCDVSHVSACGFGSPGLFVVARTPRYEGQRIGRRYQLVRLTLL